MHKTIFIPIEWKSDTRMEKNMKHSKIILASAMAALTVSLATGCSVARDQETVGEYVDGSAITAQVKAKLAQDEQTSAANISVKTINAGVVQLSGFAKSDAEKARAGEVAKSVKGVNQVQNDLIVRP